MGVRGKVGVGAGEGCVVEISRGGGYLMSFVVGMKLTADSSSRGKVSSSGRGFPETVQFQE